MTDEAPDSIIDLVLFVAGSVVIAASAVVGCHALCELLRRKDNEEEIEK